MVQGVALVLTPSEVESGRCPVLDEVELFPRVLPDVADPQVAVQLVERPPPWIAQPVRVHLLSWIGCVHVDAEQLAQARGFVLRVVVRVAGAATVTGAEVEHGLPALRRDRVELHHPAGGELVVA